MSIKTRTVLLIVGAILLLDQVTKAWVNHSMVLHQSIPVASFFHITYVQNTGAAFGLLAQTPDWFRQPFFFVATGAAVVVLGLFLRHIANTDRLACVVVAAILGGAVGNLIDRIRYGYVIDFLDFHWHGYHWPAFNVADASITLGVIGLLWSSMRIRRAEIQRNHMTS